MAVVPDKVLRWLYSVLGNEYKDPSKTYNDVAKILSVTPSLQPRTEVYTYENGVSALLLQLSGTLPVQFRGNTYRFPLRLWIPHDYPREPPIVYVTQAPGLLIRSGQHVSGDGRVYHPYLANWSSFWDKSSLSDFLGVLGDVFAKEPPVISEQHVHAQARPQAFAPSQPAPVPPPRPQETSRPQQASSYQSQGPGPPPRPPKPGESPAPPNQAAGEPTLPPLPPKDGANPRYSTSSSSNPSYRADNFSSGSMHGISGLNSPTRRDHRPYQGSVAPPPHVGHQHQDVPRSPLSPVLSTNRDLHPLGGRGKQYGPIPSRNPQQIQPPLQGTSSLMPQSHYKPQQPSFQHQQMHYAGLQAPQLPVVQLATKPPVIDLLSFPLDVTLPSQSADFIPPPVPTIPPNPQKNALLDALSRSLVDQTRQIVESNQAAIAPLLGQQAALRKAQSALSAEMEQLKHLDEALAANQNILRETMARADAVISTSASRRRPDIDELLVCPTVVGSQLYSLVAEVAACQDTRVALGKGLDRGRVGTEVFVKTMRQIGREEFLKRVLVRKIGKGMGLENVENNR